GRGGPSNYVRL
uniref:Extended FMRFamide-9 n=1 Tax=Praedatophasma maraisi TaxID=409170 RepID=FAR9_PRAMA|nr:RecName: Full=Extended FMRFamide-9; Short=FMRFa-9 [Praedatophasma maraisi]